MTMYALVIDNVIAHQYTALPPDHWVADTPTSGYFVPLTADNAASYGYLPVVRQTPPADTATTTWDQTLTIDTAVTYGWVERPKTADELDRDARQQKGAVVGQAVTTLRQWADDAVATTVTTGNNNAVTQTVVNRFGVLCDRLADLVEHQGLDRQ